VFRCWICCDDYFKSSNETLLAIRQGHTTRWFVSKSCKQEKSYWVHLHTVTIIIVIIIIVIDSIRTTPSSTLHTLRLLIRGGFPNLGHVSRQGTEHVQTTSLLRLNGIVDKISTVQQATYLISASSFKSFQVNSDSTFFLCRQLWLHHGNEKGGDDVYHIFVNIFMKIYIQYYYYYYYYSVHNLPVYLRTTLSSTLRLLIRQVVSRTSGTCQGRVQDMSKQRRSSFMSSPCV
jgi:hypothetical protein